MIPFRKVQLEDRDWINDCLKKADYRACEYSFVNNYIWRNVYDLQVSMIHGLYCTRNGKGEEKAYSFPVGEGDLKKVIEELMLDANERGVNFILRAIPEEKVEELHQLFPDTFITEANRDDSDYIYLSEKLATLAGKKLHGKRNHIARFKDNPNWQYEEITAKNMDDIFAMNKKWCRIYHCSEDESLNHERKAVEEAVQNLEALHLVGGCIRRDGEVIAYSIGEPLNSDTFVVHIEKAFPEIQGAYPMINQQFVLHNCMDFMYVNREEDLGEEGLRKAKLSYYPEIILPKYTAVLK